MILIKAYADLIAHGHRFQVFTLLILMLLVGLTEGIGIMLLVPLLDLLSGGSTQQGVAQILFHLLGLLGIPQSTGGVLTAFVGLVALRSAMQFSRDHLSAKLQHEIVDRLRLGCFSALMQVQWQWLINNRQSVTGNCTPLP